MKKQIAAALCSVLACLLVAGHVSAQAPDAIHSVMRQSVTLEFDNLTLDQCADRLQTLTGRKVIVHESLRPLLEARQLHLQSGDGLGVPVNEPQPGEGLHQVQQPIGFSCSLRDMPLGAALRVFLEHYGLGCAVLGDSLVIATTEKSRELVNAQTVELQFEKVALAKAVDDLAGRYGIALVLDVQAVKDAKTPITLTARDVSLEEAVHLLADGAGLKAGPLSAGWILTSADKARVWQQRTQRARESAKARPIPAGYPSPFGGGLAGGGLAGGIGGPMVGGVPNLAALEVPPALLQTAGPPPRVGQVAAAKVLQAAPPQQPAPPRKSLAADTLKKLSEPFGINDDAPLSLKDAIQVMEDSGFPKIVLRTSAFKEDNPDAPDLYETAVRWPGKGLSRGKALRLILDQIPTGNANYLVRPGYILITTNDSMTPNHQFVSGTVFVQRPLEEALQELSELSGISIVLDPRVGAKAKTPITARFASETNLAQATRLLADMADLKAVRVDGIMYVTARSNATVFPDEPPVSGKYTRRDVAQ